MTTSAERDQLIKETARYLAGSTSHNPLRFRKVIMSFTSETLSRINNFNFSDVDREMITSGFFFFHWNEAVTNDYLSMIRAAGNHIMVADIDHYVDALKFCEGMVQHSGGDYPEERAEQIIAITRVLSHLSNKDENILVPFKDGNAWKSLPFINDPKLRALVVNSPQRDTVVKIITERDIMDADIITEMLSTGTPALIDGAL